MRQSLRYAHLFVPREPILNSRDNEHIISGHTQSEQATIQAKLSEGLSPTEIAREMGYRAALFIKQRL